MGATLWFQHEIEARPEKDFVSAMNNQKIKQLLGPGRTKVYLLILLAPWWFTSSHFNDCASHTPDICRAERLEGWGSAHKIRTNRE